MLPVDSYPVRTFFSWLPDSNFLLSPHIVEGTRNLPGASFVGSLILLMKALPSSLPKDPIFQYYHLGVRWENEFERSTNIETKAPGANYVGIFLILVRSAHPILESGIEEHASNSQICI